MARLLDPIDGTDTGQIAECLGLNPTEFLQVASSYDTTHSDIGMGLMSQMSDEERFRGVEKLTVMCHQCNTETEFPGVFRKRGESDLRVRQRFALACLHFLSLPFPSLLDSHRYPHVSSRTRRVARNSFNVNRTTGRDSVQ